jgi:hypothetical protein
MHEQFVWLTHWVAALSTWHVKSSSIRQSKILKYGASGCVTRRFLVAELKYYDKGGVAEECICHILKKLIAFYPKIIIYF